METGVTERTFLRNGKNRTERRSKSLTQSEIETNVNSDSKECKSNTDSPNAPSSDRLPELAMTSNGTSSNDSQEKKMTSTNGLTNGSGTELRRRGQNKV